MGKQTVSSVISTVLLVLTVIFFAELITSCNVSTANLSDVKLCSSLSGNTCSEDVMKFGSDVSAIHCTANLNNAPPKTKVLFNWKKDGEGIGNAEVEAESGYVRSTFTPSEPIPPGKYSVTVKLETDNSKPVIKEFVVE